MTSRVQSKELPLAQAALFDQEITAIAAALYDAGDQPESGGLMGGLAGITLFFACLARRCPGEKNEAIACAYLERLSDALSQEQLYHNLSSGIAGIAFVFQHLRNIGLLDASEDINLGEIDQAISAGADRDCTMGNWDPLHGLAGLGLYFIERHRETGETSYLEKIVDHLVALRSIDQEYSVWITPGVPGYSRDNYNFGMAHGMPGLLCFLARVYALGIKKTVLAELIPSCLSFLLTHRGREDAYAFPSAIGVRQPHTPHQLRNGWCYGDLGMATALIHCGRAMSRPEWTSTGIDIALKTTTISFDESGCTEASLCHGTMGLVHQYHRFYQATKDSRFKSAAAHWLDLTNKPYSRPEAVPSFGLLEGIAGIGLILLSCRHNEPPGWDLIFQTDV